MNQSFPSFLHAIAEGIAQTKADELAVKQKLTVPKNEYVEKEKNIVLPSLQQHWAQTMGRIEKGQKALADYVNKLPVPEKESMQKEMEKASQTLQSIGSQLSLDGPSLQEQAHLQNATLLTIYKAGYACYQEKKLEEAFSIFLTLVLLNSRVADYWLALGTVQRALLEEKAALYSFSLVSLLDPNNTTSRIQCIDIYLHMHQIEDAHAELDALINIVETGKLEAIRPQIALLQKRIQNANTPPAQL